VLNTRMRPQYLDFYSGRGKSSLGLNAYFLQLPLDMGGGEGKALFIDTEGKPHHECTHILRPTLSVVLSLHACDTETRQARIVYLLLMWCQVSLATLFFIFFPPLSRANSGCLVSPGPKIDFTCKEALY
jgi:hypothetical protein